jgi:hypothetical protein
MDFPFEHEIEFEGVCVGVIEGVCVVAPGIGAIGARHWHIESLKVEGWSRDKGRQWVTIDGRDPRYAAIAVDIINRHRDDIDEAWANEVRHARDYARADQARDAVRHSLAESSAK